MSVSLPISSHTKAVEDAKTTTAGEILFDRITYTGLGFIVNEMASIWLADVMMHGRGKPMADKTGAWLAETFPQLFKDSIANGAMKATAEQNAAALVKMLALVTPGNVLIAPIKWLEDHEESWVRRLNHMADAFSGRKLTWEEMEMRDALVKDRLCAQPSQTWTSLLLGRGMGLGWSVGLGHTLGARGIDAIENFSENLLVGHSPHVQGRTRRYARLAGIETVSCATTSVVVEASSKFFAWLMGRGKDKETALIDNPHLECKTPGFAQKIALQQAQAPQNSLSV